ncbi:MAG: RNA polymerase sigma factor [Candidatus Omnitrophota bacterium]
MLSKITGRKMQDIADNTLIKASRGDIEAFEEIYRTASGYVYTVALKVAGSREDAEEVTQDVFLSIHKNLKSFQFRSSFKTWIYRITVNKAINAYRKRVKERGKKMPFDDEIAVEEIKPPGVSSLDKEHQKKLVSVMLESLPLDQRACVVLKEIEGLKYKEIARVLQININTVRSRLKRAREKLISRYGGKEQKS